MSAASISEYLEADHRRLDALLTQAMDALGAGAIAQAKAAFASFQAGIERHINLEERLLLPRIEEETGPVGPAQVMRDEHGRILRGVWNISSKLEGSDHQGCLEELDSLARLLSTHNLKEERVLYPTAERILLGLGERDAVLESMQESEGSPSTTAQAL